MKIRLAFVYIQNSDFYELRNRTKFQIYCRVGNENQTSLCIYTHISGFYELTGRNRTRFQILLPSK